MQKQEHTKIFIIENNKQFALLLEAELKNAFAEKEHSLHVFENGELCLQFLHIKPNLVILNSNSANAMNSLEVVRTIRTKSPHTDVMLLSDDEETELFFKAQPVNAYGYLVKNAELPYKLNYSLREWLKLKASPKPY